MTTTTTEPITTFECTGCDQLVTRVPVRDDLEVFWVGTSTARAWCTLDCLETYAERVTSGGA